MAWTAAQEHEDARLVGSNAAQAALGIDTGRHGPGQAHGEGTNAAGLKQAAPCEGMPHRIISSGRVGVASKVDNNRSGGHCR